LIKDLNIKPETLKLLQERIGNTLEHTGIGNNFLRERVDKWDYKKIKSFCTAGC
jgi:hypothetical protein